jgi:hypothetical protein
VEKFGEETRNPITHCRWLELICERHPWLAETVVGFKSQPGGRHEATAVHHRWSRSRMAARGAFTAITNKIPVVGVLWHAGSAAQEDVYR